MIGQTISHFKILEKLGEGGMGEVYLAEDTHLDRKVALKFLPTQYTSDAEMVERFKREAKAAAALNHPNIITVFDVNEHVGKTFIAMEYVRGESLREQMKEEIEPEKAIELISQVCDGLQKAHQADIIHRDIKPENIMIDEDGRVRILDFGLAKLKNVSKLTQTATTLGTLNYMSPEQLQGMEVDARSDIWSVAVVLYELLTARVPFHGEYEASLIYSILHDDLEPTEEGETLAGTESVISKALSKAPEERYQGIGELRADLQAVQKGRPPTAATTTQIERQDRVPFFRTVLDRRMAQILGLYLGGCWAVVQFVNWLVNRYVLSTHLPDFSLVALLSLLPSVLLMAYFHGKPGRDRWTKVEKISIPVNLLVTAAILVVMFSGKALGAAQKTVVLEDEDGNRFERVIPKTEFRKRIGIFPFENTTGDSTYDWLQNGITNLIIYDLVQDLFIDSEWGYHYGNAGDINAAGYHGGIGMPMTFMRGIAVEGKWGHFMSGLFSVKNGLFEFVSRLYDTRRAKLIKENIFSGSDIFSLVDNISQQLKYDLNLPQSHIENSIDLSISEIETNSFAACSLYTLARNLTHFTDRWEAAKELYEKCVAKDSTYTSALWNLANIYHQLGNQEAGLRTIEKAVRFAFKFPEPLQFDLKAHYYALKDQPEKSLSILKMKVELFPGDISGREVLAQVHARRGELGLAIEQYKEILKLDPEQDMLHKIGWMYGGLKDYKNALEYYREEAKKAPNDSRSYVAIAEIHALMGNYDQARANYERAQLIDHNSQLPSKELAIIEMRTGNYNKALELLSSALDQSKTHEERTTLYAALIDFYFVQGKTKEGLNYTQRWIESYRSSGSYSPVGFSNYKTYGEALYYIEADRIDAASEIANYLEKQSPTSYKSNISWIQTLISLEHAKPESAAKHLQVIEESALMQQHYGFQVIVSLAKGLIFELKGEYEQARSEYQRCLEIPILEPTTFYWVLQEPELGLSRCYRNLNKLHDAESTLKGFLKVHPYHPKALHEMALIYWEMGKEEKALEHLNKALYVWGEADPDYKPAKLAREKLAEWTM